MNKILNSTNDWTILAIRVMNVRKPCICDCP